MPVREPCCYKPGELLKRSNPAPYLVNVGPGSAGLQVKVFFIWGSTCLCCAIFTYFCVPEVCIIINSEGCPDGLQTKGLSLEQIDVMYQNTTPARSLEYRRKLMAGGISANAGSETSQGTKVQDEKTQDEKTGGSSEA